MIVRCGPAHPDDIVAVDALASQAGVVIDAQRSLSQSQARLRVARAVEQRELVGFALVWHLADEWELIDLVTSTERRRRGVASSLLNYLVREATSLGVGAVLLEVRASNAAAIALYEKHGFVLVSQRKHYYRAPLEDALCMRLNLRA